MYCFGVAHNTISKIIRQVCDAIFAEFAEKLIPSPETPEECKNIAMQFGNWWQLHNCVGALDRKHIVKQCPKGILMALVDADFLFILAEVGSNGSACDAQVFEEAINNVGPT